MKTFVARSCEVKVDPSVKSSNKGLDDLLFDEETGTTSDDLSIDDSKVCSVTGSKKDFGLRSDELDESWDVGERELVDPVYVYDLELVEGELVDPVGELELVEAVDVRSFRSSSALELEESLDVGERE